MCLEGTTIGIIVVVPLREAHALQHLKTTWRMITMSIRDIAIQLADQYYNETADYSIYQELTTEEEVTNFKCRYGF